MLLLLRIIVFDLIMFVFELFLYCYSMSAKCYIWYVRFLLLHITEHVQFNKVTDHVVCLVAENMATGLSSVV